MSIDPSDAAPHEPVPFDERHDLLVRGHGQAGERGQQLQDFRRRSRFPHASSPITNW